MENNTEIYFSARLSG